MHGCSDVVVEIVVQNAFSWIWHMQKGMGQGTSWKMSILWNLCWN